MKNIFKNWIVSIVFKKKSVESNINSKKEIYCLYCGKLIIDAKRNSRKFCSGEHRIKFYKEKRTNKRKIRREELLSKEHKCLYCNELIPKERIIQNAKYCSKRHKILAFVKRVKDKRTTRTKEFLNKEHRCLYCNEPIPEKRVIARAKFCSLDHKTKFHIQKDKEKRTTSRKKSIDENKLFCHYCGKPLNVNSLTRKFCNRKCCNAFKNHKRWNRPIIVRINSKTTIETRKYDKIAEVREKYYNLTNPDREKDIKQEEFEFVEKI